ncbi:homoserine O-acetyltransferase MetX [Corynebacterium ulceribovis]|uniref:homoserine O-acetyltransferase MetX n=1 Tax=Corynebacterium ulceribovis TaxID=487732 RepID=UPI00036C163A|nr:homoserine O-acetyltransferase [Corynebacterium ulceribovis]
MQLLPSQGEIGYIPIGSFTTEAGAVIPDVTVAVQRWGKLNDQLNNVVLVEHALTGDTNAAGDGGWWAELIGPGKAIDTNRWCVVCTNVIGGCKGSTGPSSPHPEDGKPWGSRFPALSIRDLVNVEKQLLDAIDIHHIAAVIGGSLGGARTMEWTLMYPEMIDAAVIAAVSARASAWQIGIQSAQIQAIDHDPNWHGGDYYDKGVTPAAGLSLARQIAHLTYRGELEVDDRFGVKPQEGEDPYGPFHRPDQRFQVESYLQYQGAKLVERFDAGSYVILTDTLNRHDIGRGRGGMVAALESSTIPTVVIGVTTDVLYPLHQQEHLTRHLGACLGLEVIDSPVGHDGFLTETRRMSGILRRFMFTVVGIQERSTKHARALRD